MLTRLQRHNQKRALERHESVSRLKNYRVLWKRYMAAVETLAETQQKLRDREKYTVCLGVERGYDYPLIALTTMIHPREITQGLMVGNPMNVNYAATRISHEVAEKVCNAIVEFVRKGSNATF